MNNEIQALRRMAQVLARVATPIERQNIARRIAQKTKGDDSELALSLAHAAALFWPGDAEKTAEVLQQITLAFDAGELGGFIPREHRHVLFTDLTVWPDCPPMAADSPLRHWVPDAPAQPQAATPAPVVAVGASDGVEPEKAGPVWRLKASIQRAPGYRWPLYQVLKAASIAGQPCPKARDVLNIWGLNPPPDVQVMPDGVKYNDGLGNPKEADLKAIGQAIKNLMK